MPFVKRNFFAKEPVALFLFVMKNLNISQRDAQRMIQKGRAQKGEMTLFNSGEKVTGKITLSVFEPLTSKERKIAPIYDDQDFMVFDKPSGILVHPNTFEAKYSMLDVVRLHGGKEANIVHRLDKETSGLLLATRHKKAEIEFKKAFENRTIKKEYLAWVDGRFKEEIKVNIGLEKRIDFSKNKHKVTTSKERGKWATTDFHPLFYDEKLDATLVRCMPKTGRMHQIRVHLFHVKHRILGDPLYGVNFDTSNRYLDGKLTEKDRAFYTGAKRLMLHANELEFSFQKQDFQIRTNTDFALLSFFISPKEDRAKPIY